MKQVSSNNWLRSGLLLVLLCCFSFLAGQYYSDWCKSIQPSVLNNQNPSHPVLVKTDTVYKWSVPPKSVKRYVKPTRKDSIIIEHFIPTTTVIYQPDTLLLKQVDSLPHRLVGVKFGLKEKALSTKVIDSTGRLTQSQFRLTDAPITQIEIFASGNVIVEADSSALARSLRKTKWRRIGNWTLMGIGFAAGLLLGGSGQ